MKVIGRGAYGGRGFIVELSREEMSALHVQSWDMDGEVPVGTEIDVLTRLRPTLKFEESALAGPHMVGRLREMADELEKGLAALRGV